MNIHAAAQTICGRRILLVNASPLPDCPNVVRSGTMVCHAGNRHMGNLLFLIRVSRPILWPVLPLVYLLGLTSADASLSTIVVLQALVLTLPMNLIGCGLNDIYDYE